MDWWDCQHEWESKIDSQYSNELYTDVCCIKCKCPGEMDNNTKEVYWPTT